MNLFVFTPLRKKTFILTILLELLLSPLIFLIYVGVFPLFLPWFFQYKGGFFLGGLDPTILGWILFIIILLIIALLISWLLTFSPLKLDTKQKRYFFGFFSIGLLFFSLLQNLFFAFLLPALNYVLPLFSCDVNGCQAIGIAGSLVKWLAAFIAVFFIAFVFSWPIRYTDKVSSIKNQPSQQNNNNFKI